MAKKQFKRKPTNKPIVPPKEVVEANEKLKKRARHIEAADALQPGKFVRIDLKKVYMYCCASFTNKEIASLLDVKYETFTQWINPVSKTYKPELAEAIRKGREDVIAKVATRLHSRAMGYKHKATKFFYDSNTGEVVKQDYIQHYPPSETAAAFILKNRRPQDWKDKPVEDVNPELMTGATNINIITDDSKIEELLKRKEDFQNNKSAKE